MTETRSSYSPTQTSPLAPQNERFNDEASSQLVLFEHFPAQSGTVGTGSKITLNS